jgi:co-chaperonin GroES (HSP10)
MLEKKITKNVIRPCGHKVLVKADDVEKEHAIEGTDIKLEIVHHNEQMHKASQISGTIVAIGPDAWEAFRKVDAEGNWVNGQPWAVVGDKVYFAKYAGHLLEPNEGEQYMLLNDEDINAIIEQVEIDE